MNDDEAAVAAEPVGFDPVPASAAGGVTAASTDGSLQRLLAAGRIGWAIVDVAGAVVVVGFVLGRLSLVVVPVVLAVFPATLLAPLANRLKRHLPDAVAASIALVAGFAAVGLVVALMVPLVVAELPRLADSAGEGVGEVARFLNEGLVGLDLGGVAGLVDRAREQLGDLGELAGPALDAATAAFELVVATALVVVVLFFYFEGRRPDRSGPARGRPTAHAAAASTDG